MAAPIYFDPTRRRVSVPPPVAVKAPVATPAPERAAYFKPTPRRRSGPPTSEELAAFVAQLAPVTVRSLEMLKAPGETLLENVTRRVAYAPRCPVCFALGDGELGHRRGCRIVAEATYCQNRRRRWRPKAESPEASEDEANSLPF